MIKINNVTDKLIFSNTTNDEIETIIAIKTQTVKLVNTENIKHINNIGIKIILLHLLVSFLNHLHLLPFEEVQIVNHGSLF